MKERTRRIAAALLLVAFAAFVGGNTLCVHTHSGPYGAVTHSHPYLPSSHHSHTSAQFETIGLINSLSFDSGSTPETYIPADVLSTAIVCGREATGNPGASVALPNRRGPPSIA